MAIVQILRQKRVRAELDRSNDAIGKKIRQATLRKITNVLVVGEREASDETVTLRRYGQQEQTTMPLVAFVEQVMRASKRDAPHNHAANMLQWTARRRP